MDDVETLNFLCMMRRYFGEWMGVWFMSHGRTCYDVVHCDCKQHFTTAYLTHSLGVSRRAVALERPLDSS